MNLIKVYLNDNYYLAGYYKFNLPNEQMIDELKSIKLYHDEKCKNLFVIIPTDKVAYIEFMYGAEGFTNKILRQ